MKKIIISLAIVAAVAAVVVVGTTAFFSDEEKSTGNTFTAGTIDIAVDGQNPWSRSNPVTLSDMKPSQVAYDNFVIHNVGSNPANIEKSLTFNHQTDDNLPVSEPECLAESGQWTDGPNGGCSSNTAVYDLENVMNYDLSVYVYNVDPATNPEAQAKWWQIIYTDGMNKTLADVYGPGVEQLPKKVFLGMVPKNWYMKVVQSYHMRSETDNKYQGDTLHFDITLTATQLTGTVLFENKDFANAQNPTIVHNDGVSGQMSYTVKDAKFNFSFSGNAPLASTAYSLVFYPELFSIPSGPGWPGPVTILGTGNTAADKSIAISGSHNFGQDIRNMKVWLVKSADLTGSNFNSWHGNDYLFELGLMDYYDSGN